MNDDEYSKAVRRAESIVSGLIDPALRSVAFEQVLGSILSGARSSHPVRAQTRASSIPPSKTEPRKDLQRGTVAGGPSAWVERLQEEGYFTEARTITDVVESIRATGHNVLSKDVTYPLVRLVAPAVRKLRRERQQIGGRGKKVWVYRNY